MSTNEAALPQSTVRVAQADPDGILLVIHAGAGNRGKEGHAGTSRPGGAGSEQGP